MGTTISEYYSQMEIDMLKVTFVLVLHILSVLKTSLMILQSEAWMTASFYTTICFFSTEYWMNVGNSRFLLKFYVWGEFKYSNLCLFKKCYFCLAIPPRRPHKSCSHTSLCLKRREKYFKCIGSASKCLLPETKHFLAIFREREWKVVLLTWQAVKTLRNPGFPAANVKELLIFFKSEIFKVDWSPFPLLNQKLRTAWQYDKLISKKNFNLHSHSKGVQALIVSP